MPTRDRITEFIAMIEAGQFLEAIPRFYDENMTAQENCDPPRIGRNAQIENEKRALARYRFDAIRVASYVLDGDRVAIHYVFDITTTTGDALRMDEIAYQRWENDRIVSERYFYDPAQRKPRPG